MSWSPSPSASKRYSSAPSAPTEWSYSSAEPSPSAPAASIHTSLSDIAIPNSVRRLPVLPQTIGGGENRVLPDPCQRRDGGGRGRGRFRQVMGWLRWVEG